MVKHRSNNGRGKNAGKNGGNYKGAEQGPYEPSAKDMEIYAAHLGESLTYRQLATRFGVCHQTIANVLNRMDDHLRPGLTKDINRHRTRHTGHLQSIFHRAMAAWDKSVEPAVEVAQTTGDNPSQTVKYKGQSGNSSHLRAAIEALRDIRGIWGADKPPVIEPENQIRVAGKTPLEVKKELQRKLLEALGATDN